MAVTETLRALGSWGISFKPTMPDEVWKKIEYFGHICIHVGNPTGLLDDSLLKSARYVGPVRSITDNTEGSRSIGGLGMATWLGDPDGKGDIIKDPLVVNDEFHNVIADLLPASGSITAGSIFNIGQNFSTTFQFVNPRDAIDYVCQTVGAAWRVNGDGTLDAGTEAQLFVTTPKCIVVNKRISRNVAAFEDMFLHGLAGTAETSRDVEDYTTDVLLLAQGINGQFVQAEANTPVLEIPFVDIHGNPVKLERIVQESETDATNAPARAQLQLNRFKGSRDALTLSTSNYDIDGTARVGDYLWVYDPGMGLMDLANEVPFRSQTINPFKLRLTETTWPIVAGMAVLYRTGDGEWINLSKHFIPESGDTTLVVGGYNRSLTEGGSGVFPIEQPPDSSVPDVTVWTPPFRQGVYQSAISGQARAEALLTWLQPDNTDTTTILDGHHYEIRYRRSTTPIYPVTYDYIASLALTYDQWEALAQTPTYDSPIHYAETEWQTAYAPFDVQAYRLQELVPAMPYEAQIRAVDSADPPNVGAWSAVTNWLTTKDDIPPSTPAAPTVAANPMAVQMTHNLGVSTGGTFNLERDLHHLELHRSGDKFFSPDDSTLVGKVLANYGMMITQTPVVQTFQIKELTQGWFKVVAVDEAGNRSLPSTAVARTADLISDQYISNLTASKITAGNITADWFVGSDITGGAIHVIGDAGIDVSGGGDVKIYDGALVIFNAAGHKIVEVGECADGRHGVQVYKDNGTRVARMGELASGAEGIEVINDLGQLVRVDTLAFGIQAASVTTKQARSGGYGDLATFGPSVNVTIGNSGRCIVLLSGGIEPGILGGGNAAIGFDMSGPSAYFRAASVFESQWVAILGDNVVTDTSLTKAILVSSLPSAGTYTITMKYWTNGASHSFFDRHLIVIPF